MHRTFPNLPGLLPKNLLSKVSPRSAHSQERLLAILSCHIEGGLGCFADSNSIPQNRTTTFHPVLTAAILRKYLLLLVERLFQRCHLSLIDEVLKCGDSHDKKFTCFPKFNRVVCIYNFRSVRRLQEFCQTFLRFM